MIQLPGSDRITSLLVSFLDAQSQRAQLAASNIANADTPGYVAKDLNFTDYLRQAANDAVAPAGSPMNLLTLVSDGPSLVEQTGNPIGIDGNTVDMAHESATMADAGMQYQTGIQMLSARWRTLRSAIREGK